MDLKVFDDLISQLQDNLKYERVLHSMGVAYTASSLAMRYKYEPAERAFITGLLHDCAKYRDTNKLLNECEDELYVLSEFDKENPSLIHAKLGPIIAQNNYGIFDVEVQNAIRNHTTGAPNMDLLSKIIFVADYIEPNRDDVLPRITKIQETAFEDLDLAVYMIMEDTLKHLENCGKKIDPMTQTAFEFYKNLIESRK